MDAQHAKVAPAVRVRTYADKGVLLASVGLTGSIDEAERALTMARELDDAALLIRALLACGSNTAYDAEVARPYFAEAARLARELGDSWRLSQILGRQMMAAMASGDPVAAVIAAGEGLQVAHAIGDRFTARQCRFAEGWARLFQGDLAGALGPIGEVIGEAITAHDPMLRMIGLAQQVSRWPTSVTAAVPEPRPMRPWKPRPSLSNPPRALVTRWSGLRRCPAAMRRRLGRRMKRHASAPVRTPAWRVCTPSRAWRRWPAAIRPRPVAGPMMPSRR